MPDTPNHNILAAMREVEEGDKRMESDPEGQAIDYARTCVRNSYPIVKFARRLLKVLAIAPAPGHAPQDIFSRRLDALERDYPGVLEDKRSEKGS